jgi:hypothetical protein
MNRRDFFKKSMLTGIVMSLFGFISLKSKSKIPISNSSINRLNTRRCIIEIRKDLEKISKYFVYEPNDQYTRNRFNSCIRELLDQKYLYKKLINNYSLINDLTTNTPDLIDKGIMTGKLIIQLNRSVEYTVIDFQLSRV